jgi:multidrug efflux system outer membrane protein
LSAQWQVDLFGRVRRQTEAAQAQVYATEQGRRAVVLSVVTSVAASYIALRTLDAQLEIARATAANYAETRRIFELRFAGGVVSQVEVAQIESQYQQALAAIPELERQIAAQENLLGILLGRNPGPIARGKPVAQFAAPAIPAGLPSSLLERRPDILQAEFNLVAANADIGVAKSLYYPTLTLTGALGSVSTALGDFLSGPATAWSVAAGLAGPVFTFGAIEGQVQSAEAGDRAAVAFYQQTILGALRETNDALVGADRKRQEAGAQAKRVLALRDAARLSRLRFDNGYAGYLEVLYAENELFSGELAAVRSQGEVYTELVGVYRALGGGWIDDAGRLAPQPQLAAPAGPAATAAAN